MMDELKAANIREMLVEMLVGAAGKSDAHWRDIIGEVEALPIWLHPNCNWRVAPTAADQDDLFAVSRVVELVRIEHPYVHG